MLGPARGVAQLAPLLPSSVARTLRPAMSRFATGVTVVTTAVGDDVHGMTANGFMSVSLDPPLVVVSLGRCRMASLLPRTGRYAVSVLDRDQLGLARHFAGDRDDPPVAPHFVWWRGLPFIAGALAHVGCRVRDVHEAGDHSLWVGRVEHLEYRDGVPLLFYEGAFRTLPDTTGGPA